MSSPPARPAIYHITHGRNLAGIIADRCLWSDAEMMARGGPQASIGISEIKRKRREEIAVACHPGTMVGQFVPFYFCPRSVMLYLLYKGNHPGLTFADGQRNIIHLAADFHEAVDWASAHARPWAFTDRNAGSGYFQSFRDPDQLGRLDWDHIPKHDFRERVVKEAKQAEFLIHRSFPWSLVRTIGVVNERIAERVREIVSDSDHRPDVQVRADWYYVPINPQSGGGTI